MFAFITPLLLLAAFILLLLVSLSTPIIKSIDLLKLSATITEGIGGISFANAQVTGNVKFGVWGYCISAINADISGENLSEPGSCSPKHLGFTLDSTVANFLGVSNISNDISHAVTAVLVLHPIACGITFLAFALSLFMLVRYRPDARSRLCSGVTLGVAILAAVVTTVVFLIDVIFVAVARHKIADSTNNQVKATWGSGTWLALAAAVLLWMSCVGACCGIFAWGGRRKRVDRRY